MFTTLFSVLALLPSHLAGFAIDPPPVPDANSSLFTSISIKSYWPKNQTLVGVTTGLGPRCNWLEMEALCSATYPGHALAARVGALANAASTLCPNDTLVPLGRMKKMISMHMFGDNYFRIQQDDALADGVETHDTYLALDWSYSQLIKVDNDTTFRCAVCQMSDHLDVLTTPIHPQHNNSIYAYDLELVSNDPVDDISLMAKGSERTNQLIADLAKVFDISAAELRWHGAKLNEDQKAVVHVYYDRQEGGNISWFHYLHWYDVYADYDGVDGFKVTMIKLNTECLHSTTLLENAKRDYILTGEVAASLDAYNGAINTMECFWNGDPEVESASWTPRLDWYIVWGFRDITSRSLINFIELRGDRLPRELKTLDVEAAFAIQFVVISPFVSMFKPSAIVGMMNMLGALHTIDRTKSTVAALMLYSMPINLSTLLLRLFSAEDVKVKVLRSQYVNVVLAAGDPSNPVVGIAVAIGRDKVGNALTDARHLNKGNTSVSVNTTSIVVTVSDSIAVDSNHLDLAVLGAHIEVPGDPPLDKSIGSWMAFVQMGYTRNLTKSTEADYVDIAFNPAFEHPSLRGKCAERNFGKGQELGKDEWYTGNCRILKSPRDKMVVCRCNNISSVHQEKETDTQEQNTELKIAVYIIYGFDATLSTYLANNLTLVIVMIVVGVMSAAGLLCVILTALLFPEWRKDPGHKIFLHMVFSLTVNLILGFVNNFVSIDTKSAACIAIGVVRHYSFLVMFVWMMVLSGLQFKRLTTIAGAKTTSHLILKVSLIAWGVPLVPIVVMLAWDTGFYKSEVSNRGYCYPEGFAFQATVQVPAGAILVANLLIFVFILNHIYGWVKCGDDAEVRKHEGDNRAEQLRRLSTTIFIFFLFGFTWVFHFLSEEGIINSEFLFEFMFLITASFHLLMLSVFFILLDKKTRELWADAGYGCSTSCLCSK